jgi:Homeodomain-like domain
MPATAVAQPYTPPAIQGDVITLYAQGTSKRRISKELGIARATVDNILARYSQSEPKNASRVQRMLPKAYDAVESALTRGDARIALDLLKVTDLAPTSAPQYRVEGDMHVSQAVNLLPSTPSSASTAVTTGTSSNTGSTGTEAPEKVAACSTDVPYLTNFLAQCPIELIEQELARRKTCGQTDSQAIQVAHPLSTQAERGTAPVRPVGEIIDAEVVR